MQRYSDTDLLTLLNDIESDRVERKASFRGDTPKKARQAVCAFANDLPNHNQSGVLFIGAKDDGTPSGEAITDELILSLADMRSDGNILPLPVLTVEKRVLHGHTMAVVVISPSDMPPVKYDGRIWIRTGSRRAIANEQEERILIEKRRYKNIPYDIYPVPTATIHDLSRLFFEEEYLPAAFASDILEGNHRAYEQKLASCRMIVAPDSPIPTISGLLILGKNPQDFLSGSFIQFLRIDGVNLADHVLDAEDMYGNINTILYALPKKLAAHNRISVDIVSAPKEIRTVSYPPAALHQLIYNAVMHRTYENTNAPIRIYWFNDRVEIHSPGGPYGNVTPENFGLPGITDYRNPNISAAMKTFGFVQGFGRGIATARRELEKNGNPPPEFHVTQSSVLCILKEHI
jgi:ATP-dependent DNA helicase RecG